jgi:uncharacterized protein YdaU (DUF1376 family)
VIYWRRYGGDYLVSTIGFTAEMDGIYGRLLDAYYDREGALPSPEVPDIARCSSERPSEAVALRKVLDLKFTLRGGHYHHERADAEIALAQTARDNGGKHVGKSGKKTGKRTAKRARKVTGNTTEDVTQNTTEEATLDGGHKGQPYNRTTIQPSSPSAVQPLNRGEDLSNLTQEPPLVVEDDAPPLSAEVRDMPFPDDEPQPRVARA